SGRARSQRPALRTRRRGRAGRGDRPLRGRPGAARAIAARDQAGAHDRPGDRRPGRGLPGRGRAGGRLTPATGARPLAGGGNRLLAPALIAFLLVGVLAIGLGHLPGTGVRVGGWAVLAAAVGAVAFALMLIRIEYGLLMLPIVSVFIPL